LLDRGSGTIAIVTSPKGGMNIEEVESSKVHKFFFEPSEKIPNEILDKAAASFELS
jgi:succinyl-CoA synthetase beta subunit